MGRRIRIQDKKAIQFVTNRCFQQRFLFRPSKEVNRIILGCLARAAAKHHVRLFAFVFMSNHFHMLVQALFMNLPDFMRDFQSSVARELNRLHGREGDFFERRYSAEQVLDDEAFLDRLNYTLNNPCNDDLVRHVEDWPGINSWKFHKTQEPMVGEWLDRKELRRIRRKDDGASKEDAYETFKLELATPPMFEDLDAAEAQAKICEHIDEGARELQKERAKRRIKCVGPAKIMAKHWSHRPKDSKKSARPLCHSGCAKLRRAHREQFWATTDAYKDAMGRWREGKSKPSFPHGTIAPGHTACVGAPPRPAPFVKAETPTGV
jgi:REP element-mobilizing transposase RayT